MFEEENAKSFLSQIADRFTGSEKVETSTILSKPCFNVVQRQREHKGIHNGNV